LAERHYLQRADLIEDRNLSEPAASRIVTKVEALRSKAYAARLRAIAGEFQAQARAAGADVVNDRDRSIRAIFPEGKVLRALPAVGVPTSLQYEAIFKAVSEPNGTRPIVLY